MASDQMDEEAGSGGGKTFLILGILIGVAAGGGLGYMFAGQDVVKQSIEQEEVEEVVIEELQFVKFEKLAVPVFTKRNGRSRPAGNFLLDIVVQVRTEDNVIKIRRADFQIRQAFLIAINKNDVMMDGSTTQIDYKKASMHLKAAAVSVVGEGTVENVVIEQSVKIK